MGIIVRSRGQAGEILVEDMRDDGTQVFLICHPWDSARVTGVLVGPGEPPPEDKDLQGSFPILGVLADRKPFRITIDTSRLPAGPLQFDSERFIESAQAEAHDGVDRVTLDDRTALHWGLIEPEQVGG